MVVLNIHKIWMSKMYLVITKQFQSYFCRVLRSKVQRSKWGFQSVLKMDTLHGGFPRNLIVFFLKALSKILRSGSKSVKMTLHSCVYIEYSCPRNHPIARPESRFCRPRKLAAVCGRTHAHRVNPGLPDCLIPRAGPDLGMVQVCSCTGRQILAGAIFFFFVENRSTRKKIVK